MSRISGPRIAEPNLGTADVKRVFSDIDRFTRAPRGERSSERRSLAGSGDEGLAQAEGLSR